MGDGTALAAQGPHRQVRMTPFWRPVRRGGSGGGRTLLTSAAWVTVRVAVVVSLGLVWEIAARRADSLFFPPLGEIIVRFQENWLSGPWYRLRVSDDLIDLLVPSLQRLVPAFAIALVVGIGLGTAIGTMRRFGEVMFPVIHFIRAIPSAAKLPLFIVLFGIGNTMKVGFIAVAACIPILINTVDGVRTVDNVLLDTADVYRTSRRDRLLRVVLPAASPKIFAGIRIATGISVVVMILAELLAASDGLGYFVLLAQRQLRVLDMWAGTLLLGVFGLVFNLLLTLVERRVLRWHRRSHARPT